MKQVKVCECTYKENQGILVPISEHPKKGHLIHPSNMKKLGIEEWEVAGKFESLEQHEKWADDGFPVLA